MADPDLDDPRYTGDGPPGGAMGPAGAGARGLILIVAALVLGWALLNQYDTGSFDAPDDVGSSVEEETTTTRRSATVSVLPPTTTRAVRPPAEVRILAANGTNTSGLGARTTSFLQAAGYTTSTPTDATRILETTQVQYTAEYEAEARAVAQLLVLPGSSVRMLEESPPVGGGVGNANIVVIIGADLRLPGDTATATTSTTRRA